MSQEYIVKQQPSDFKVVEKLSISMEKSGAYACFLLEKENTTTIFAIEKIASILGIKSKEIGFCGIKDKNAITSQHISISSRYKNIIEKLEIQNIKLTFIGYLKDRLNLGNHVGNSFEIIVRNLNDEKINAVKIVPNYFGEQRFLENNIEIGKLLVKKDYKKACELLAQSKGDVKEHIDLSSNDYIGAIKELNEKIISIYVHAYQSYMFNKLLSEYIKLNLSDYVEIKELFGDLLFQKETSTSDINKELPLIGFDSEEIDIVKNILKEEGIILRDFINKQIHSLTVEGCPRKAFIELNDLKISDFEKDELNSEKKKIKVSFSLPNGSYATIVIRAMFC
jgi:tRNA pseudouridine13 synthase